jgi:hypothetical protein
MTLFLKKMPKKKMWASFQRIIEFFIQRFFTNLSKIWVWDPGPGVKKALDPGSRIRSTAKKSILICLTYRTPRNFILSTLQDRENPYRK